MSVIHIMNLFSRFVACLFIFFMVSGKEVLKASDFYQCFTFIFSVFCVPSKKYLPTYKSLRYSTFFIVLTFKLYILSFYAYDCVPFQNSF